MLERAGAKVYTLLSNAVAGERDPRCLLKVFSIFVSIAERLDLSILMEDMFELIACYYPIEYRPVCIFRLYSLLCNLLRLFSAQPT